MSLNNEFDPIGGDGVPASPDAVPQEASPRIIITAQPIQWEAHRSGQQWTEGRYGYCITLESEDLPETPYVATLGEGDPETFATLAEAQAWCQRDIDATVARWAVVAAQPPQAAPKAGARSGWVACPVCGEPDMQRDDEGEGRCIIHCTNTACASNGGTNASALSAPAERALVRVSSIDVEAMLAKCVPGGSICDPQQVADAIRSYCDAWDAPAERGVQPLTLDQIGELEFGGAVSRAHWDTIISIVRATERAHGITGGIGGTDGGA